MAIKDVCFWHEDRHAAGYCAFCGVPVCDECHTGGFCKQCIEEPPKRQDKALLLAVLFGWLGVHRYYMGFYVTGVLYTISFGLFGFGWAIDVIRILFWSTIRANEQPYFCGDRPPRCTIGIKTQESSGSFLGALGGAIGDMIVGEMSSETKSWLNMRFWRDKHRRPLLRFGQKSLI